MSPPLVVAFALAGRVDIDLSQEPLGTGQGGRRCLPQGHLADAPRKCATPCSAALKPEVFRKLYTDFAAQNPKWNEIPSQHRHRSTSGTQLEHLHPGAAVLRRLLDGARRHHRDQGRASARASSATASPPTTSPPPAASRRTVPPENISWSNGVTPVDFNSYGSRRGNDRVMTRGTFANVRIKNLMLAGERRRQYAASARWRPIDVDLRRRGAVPGRRHAHRSSSPARTTARAAAATGPPKAPPPRREGRLAKSFERIHRTNLVGMGVLPCNSRTRTTTTRSRTWPTRPSISSASSNDLKPMGEATLRVHPAERQPASTFPSSSASIPPSRSTTTAPAASCRMCSRRFYARMGRPKQSITPIFAD